MSPLKLSLSTILLFLVFPSCLSSDIIAPNQSIKDGDALVSSGQSYALGFFSLGINSTRRYVGIWYHKVSERTVVWVANRDNPINGTSGVLAISNQGNLVMYENNKSTVPFWSTNVSATSMTNCLAQLLDSGNLVLVQQDSKRVLWQSFDHGTNTLLPQMKLGMDLKTGLSWSLSSWKSKDGPGTGNMSVGIDPSGFPQLILFKGQIRWWRGGPWTGRRWSGVPEMTRKYILNTIFVNNFDEVYVVNTVNDPSIFSRMVVNESGVVERLTWNRYEQRWIKFWSAPTEQCDTYGQCGANGNCDPYQADNLICNCLPGFEPKSPLEWSLRDGSKGCIRKPNVSTCHSGEGFVKLARVKVPDTSMARANMSLSLKECEQGCLRNCSCTAYANADERGIGCLRWYGDLVDTRTYADVGQDIYIRVDAAELAQYKKNSKGLIAKKGALAVLVTPLAVAACVVFSIGYCLVKRKRKGRRGAPDDTSSLTHFQDRKKEDLEETTSPNLPIFDIKTVTAATENFSFANKLGQGGFGSVYKGRLPHGQEIAVKRLSRISRQGVEEFKNEVRMISKLQHKNLVRLFGCCSHQDEKLLVYEYLPNKSLDFFIFDKTRRELLDWSRRFEIILGIARGLLYLHQDSRLKIIHRDLKAGNVLLDAAMNPKISDFGMARIFGEDQTEANTNKVVGTYGYMSPEYAMQGLYSIKSDVFSYGVLVLEIISGRKNNEGCDESSSQKLIAQAWDLWNEGKALQIVDSTLGNSYPTNEVLKCIQVGLLCVQDNPADRPRMSEIVFMLDNETVLPSPNKPAFIIRRKQNDSESATAKGGAASINGVTITKMEGR